MGYKRDLDGCAAGMQEYLGLVSMRGYGALPCITHVMLSKLLFNLSLPQFPTCKKGVIAEHCGFSSFTCLIYSLGHCFHFCCICALGSVMFLGPIDIFHNTDDNFNRSFPFHSFDLSAPHISFP